MPSSSSSPFSGPPPEFYPGDREARAQYASTLPPRENQAVRRTALDHARLAHQEAVLDHHERVSLEALLLSDDRGPIVRAESEPAQ